MRRVANEIVDKDTIEGILKSCKVGRVATIGEDGYPYIVPLNYVYWKGGIYFHCSKKGQKLDNIALNSKVGFEVDVPLAYLDSNFSEDRNPCDVTQFYHSVIIRGRAVVVDDTLEKIDVLNALMVSHEPDQQPVEVTAEMGAVKACRVVAIKIDEMSCKANYAQSKKAEERKILADYFRNRGLPGDDMAADLIEKD